VRGGFYLYDPRFSEGAKNFDAATRHTGSVKLPSCHDRQKPEEKRGRGSFAPNNFMTDTTD